MTELSKYSKLDNTKIDHTRLNYSIDQTNHKV